MANGLRLVLVACLVVTLASCGDDGATQSGPSATLRITRGFGHELLAAQERVPLAGHGTLLRQLRDAHEARTAHEFQSVVEIDGMAIDSEGPGDPKTWATNVNGIETDVRPGAYRLYPGDVVQWDLRFWYVTLDVRATVGAFPQTFTRGVFGRRFPVKVECEKPASWPCRHVKAVLRRAGVATDGTLPPGSKLPKPPNPRRARLLVGRWDHWRQGPWARRIDEGARYSGVFARFSPDGRKLRLLDWYAHRSREEGAGTGLVAAMRPTEEDMLWVVTGVDALGVTRAARALDSSALQDAFAVAVTGDGVVKLPLKPR